MGILGRHHFSECPDCRILCDMESHRCPELVRATEKIVAMNDEGSAVSIPINAGPPPTPRQLARAWIEFLCDIGAVA